MHGFNSQILQPQPKASQALRDLQRLVPSLEAPAALSTKNMVEFDPKTMVFCGKYIYIYTNGNYFHEYT